jgi:ferritin-like metal-binding protein YciE
LNVSCAGGGVDADFLCGCEILVSGALRGSEPSAHANDSGSDGALWITRSGGRPMNKSRGARYGSWTMSKITTTTELLVEELKDLYSAESQLLKALPKMAKAAESEELQEAFTNHLKQTEGQVKRLEKVMKKLGESPKGKKCKAMEGLVAEAKEVLEEDAEPVLRDLALIVAAQKVEHYEIAGYGSARTLAEISGESEIAEILQETLDEEGETDKLLTKIAEGLNVEALSAAEAEEE